MGSLLVSLCGGKEEEEPVLARGDHVDQFAWQLTKPLLCTVWVGSFASCCLGFMLARPNMHVPCFATSMPCSFLWYALKDRCIVSAR